MREATGDIWEYATKKAVDAVCVLTNMTVAGGKLIMGGGNAREARTRFPSLPELWGRAFEKKYGKEEFLVHTISPIAIGSPFYVVAFPTKRHPSEDSDLDLIEGSAHELVKQAGMWDWRRVVLGRPGCGLGSLDWDTQVKPLIEPILDDRFTVIHFSHP